LAVTRGGLPPDTYGVEGPGGHDKQLGYAIIANQMDAPAPTNQTLLNVLLPALIAFAGTIVTLTVGWFKDRDLHEMKRRAIELQKSRLELVTAQFNLAVLAGFKDDVLSVARKAVLDASQGLDNESWLVTATEIKQKRWRSVAVIGIAIGETILVYFALFTWFASHPWRVLSVAMIVVPFSLMVVFYMFDPTLDQPARRAPKSRAVRRDSDG